MCAHGRVVIPGEVEHGGVLQVWTPTAVKPGDAEVMLSLHCDGANPTMDALRFKFVASILYRIHPHRIPFGQRVRHVWHVLRVCGSIRCPCCCWKPMQR